MIAHQSSNSNIPLVFFSLGWTLLLKGVAGAPGDLWNLWASPNTANINIPQAQKLTNEYMGHYKPDIANSLSMCDFQQVMNSKQLLQNQNQKFLICICLVLREY